VMCFGSIVEHRSAKQILHKPYHPYTQALISVIPEINPTRSEAKIA